MTKEEITAEYRNAVADAWSQYEAAGRRRVEAINEAGRVYDEKWDTLHGVGSSADKR